MIKRPTVLIISYYYLPYNSPAVYRIGSFATALVEENYEVIVLSSKTRRAPIDERIGERFTKAIDVDRTHCWELLSGGKANSFIRRVWNKITVIIENNVLPVDSYFLWMLPAALRARRLIRERNVRYVLISSPPHSSQLIGLFIPRKTGVTLITDFRDGWTHNLSQPYRNFICAKFDYILEKYILKRSDQIIANTKGNRSLLERDFPFVKDKVDIILNGYLKGDVEIASSEQNESFFQDGKFHLVYTGDCYKGYAHKILYVLRELKKLHPDLSERFSLDLCGVIDHDDLKLFSDQKMNDIFKHHGFVPYDTSISMLRSSDMALLLMLDSTPHIVASKFYFYIGNRKPILALIPEGDAADIIRDVNAGYVVTSDRLDSAVEILSKQIYESGESLVDYNDETWCQYSREYQSRKLIDLIAKIENKSLPSK